MTNTQVADLASYDLDPALIQHEMNHNSMVMSPYDTTFHNHLHAYPVPSSTATSPHARSSASPYMQNPAYHTGYGQAKSPFGTPMDLRRTSFAPSMTSPNGEYQSGDEAKERQRCTYPDCGKYFKDLKAHILTHQTERPEKCPIQTCEYHTKGFARKYDKNRHTLTHYKGTMVCGFCPGSGSAAEKSFNRADVFKRHLTTVHGVEQTPPNSRKKAPAAVNPGKKLAGYPSDATGKCSTCSQTFSNAQDFYEHLDDCVLRIVQQEDPAEAINAQRLAEVEHDASVAQTLEKNHLPLDTQTIDEALGEDDDMDFDYGEDGDDSKRRGGSMQKRSSGAVTKTRGRKNRRDYPSSWGFDKGQMKMKKRIMAVFDGKQRLAKDDMMLSTDHEVRIKLSDGKSYVTDLDVQTMKRAEGFLQPEDERGAWVADDPTEEQLKEMQRMLETGITE